MPIATFQARVFTSIEESQRKNVTYPRECRPLTEEHRAGSSASVTAEQTESHVLHFFLILISHYFLVTYYLRTARSTVGGIAALYAVKSHLLHYVLFMSASRDVLAVAQIEVNLAGIAEGKTSIIKWRGKPVFVYHRSASTVEQERSVNVSQLRDSETDEERVKKPEWLVVIGICTHLGCVPIPNAGAISGGFFCPCHGSHFDASGRIRKGPAARNLEVPNYAFINDETLLIG